MTTTDPFAKEERIKPGVRARARRLRTVPTWTEAKLWERLRKLDIRIRRQAPIGPYVADFACLRARLVIEVDGGVHNRTDVALRDLKRDAWLASEGYRVLRIDSRRIPHDLDAVIAEITQAIRLPPPSPRGGRGRGMGCSRDASGNDAGGASLPPAFHQQASYQHPTQPSPLEGEGSCA